MGKQEKDVSLGKMSYSDVAKKALEVEDMENLDMDKAIDFLKIRQDIKLGRMANSDIILLSQIEEYVAKAVDSIASSLEWSYSFSDDMELYCPDIFQEELSRELGFTHDYLKEFSCGFKDDYDIDISRYILTVRFSDLDKMANFMAKHNVVNIFDFWKDKHAELGNKIFIVSKAFLKR